jgi:hypothetical protein
VRRGPQRSEDTRRLAGRSPALDHLYHREDGSERLGSPRRLPIEGFLEETFGGWYEGTWPPPAIVRARAGLPVPMDPRKIGGRPAGS